jgi:hypothetical protein
VGERATRLLVDVLALIHDRLLTDALEGGALGNRINDLQRMLDHFGEVVVAEQGEGEATTGRESNSATGVDLTVTASQNPSAKLGIKGPVRGRRTAKDGASP